MGASKRKRGPGRGGHNPGSTPPPSREPAGGKAPAQVADTGRAEAKPDDPEIDKGPTRAGGPAMAPRPTFASAFAAGGDPRVKPSGPRLWGLNLLIGALFFLFTVDALPNSFPGFGRLNQGIDLVLDVMGLAQGEWKLFSPDPDHINAYVEAVITYSDGSTKRWTTPDWRNRSLLTKFLHGRHPKVSDAFRMDRNKAVWPQLVRWILTEVPPPEGAKPVEVELFRHWWDVPKPVDLDKEIAKYKSMPPDPEDYPSKFSFHKEKIP